MNTALKYMIREAEGRYLSGDEVDKIRQWALGMPDRLEAAERLAEREDRVVEAAADRVEAEFPDYANHVPDARSKLVRDMKLHLRYLAQGHVTDDPQAFVEGYAEWIAELLVSMSDRDRLVKAYQLLGDAMEEHVDPADYRMIEPFHRSFIEQLELA